jgi:hypothetical protein
MWSLQTIMEKCTAMYNYSNMYFKTLSSSQHLMFICCTYKWIVSRPNKVQKAVPKLFSSEPRGSKNCFQTPTKTFSNDKIVILVDPPLSNIKPKEKWEIHNSASLLDHIL